MKNLIVFAKEPVPGKAKTRLLKDLSSKSVDQIYRALVADVLAQARSVRCHRKIIYYTGTRSIGPFLKRLGKGFEYLRQHGATLGARMKAAFTRVHGRTVIIGTDCPEISSKDIENVYQKLKTYDCVLGPTYDGGYYLIGLKEVYGELFKGIPWSTGRVFQETVKKAKRLGLKVSLLPKRVDVDNLESLKHLTRRQGMRKGRSKTAVLIRQMKRSRKL